MVTLWPLPCVRVTAPARASKNCNSDVSTNFGCGCPEHLGGCPTQHCGCPGTHKSIQIDTYAARIYRTARPLTLIGVHLGPQWPPCTVPALQSVTGQPDARGSCPRARGSPLVPGSRGQASRAPGRSTSGLRRKSCPWAKSR